MFSLIMAILTIAFASIFGGIVIGIAICVISGIYTFPYSCWIRSQKQQRLLGEQLESDSFPPPKWLAYKLLNATKLYRSWITKKPHNITRF